MLQALPEHLQKMQKPIPSQPQPPQAPQDDVKPSITVAASIKKSDNAYTSLEEFEKAIAQKYSLEQAYKTLLLSLKHAFGQDNIALPKFKAEKEFTFFSGGLDELDIFYTVALRLKPLPHHDGVTQYFSRLNGTHINISEHKIEYAGLKDKRFTMDDAYDMAFATLYNSNFGSKEAPLIIEGSLTQRRMLENAIDEINELLPEEHRKHIGNRAEKTLNLPKGNLSRYFERALELEAAVRAERPKAAAETAEASQKIVASFPPTENRRFTLTRSTRADVSKGPSKQSSNSSPSTSATCFSGAVANNKTAGDDKIAATKTTSAHQPEAKAPQTAEAGPA